MKMLGLLTSAALVLPVAAFSDFSGSYVGLGVGTAQGDIEVGADSATGEFDFNDGTALSIFGGFNVRSGDLVYGGEFAYNSLSDFFVESPAGDDFGDDDEVENLMDLRGRVGYVIDDLMLYGALGFSFGNYVEPGFDDYSVSGLSVGAGAEYRLDDGFFVGADYTTRMLSGEGDDSDVEADMNLSSFMVRVGYSF